MAKIDGRAMIQATITLGLSEDEAGALDALAGYGIEPFLEVFYPKLGRAYMEPHEKGLRSLFASIRGGDTGIPLFLKRAKEAREVFTGQKQAKDYPVETA